MAIDTIKANAIFDGAVDTADLASGAVTSAKLDTNIDIAGTLDVTGALTADSNATVAGNLTVDTNTFYVDSANNRVGVGNISPQKQLHINYANSNSGQMQITNTSTGATATDGVLFGYNASNDVIINNQEATRTVFYTNGAERMSILSSGGLTFNGDTASANALDDYEEGTWTPDLQFNGTSQSSYGSRTGGYVKIGRVVTATSRISGTASATGVIKVFGLPYAPDSPDGTDAIQTCAIWSTTLAVPGTGYAIGRIDQDGNSYVQPMFIINNGEQGVTWTSGNAFNLSFTITYLSV